MSTLSSRHKFISTIHDCIELLRVSVLSWRFAVGRYFGRCESRFDTWSLAVHILNTIHAVIRKFFILISNRAFSNVRVLNRKRI
jgi:hypothetical protein